MRGSDSGGRPDSLGALVLAGGNSRRMGRDKAALPFGPTDFLGRVVGQLSDFDELLLSVGAAGGPAGRGLTMVPDLYPGAGPLGGLHAGLRACRSDALLTVACDMPLFERGLARYLAAFVGPDRDAFVCVDRAGRLHPLCGVYRKSALPLIEARLEAGEYRLLSALERLRVKRVPLEHSAYPDEVLTNVNTPGEYAALSRRPPDPPVLAICGIKNSGKTTFLTRLIPRLRDRGLRVAVVKHDGHQFEPDVPGTDSFRLRRAGADGVAVYSDRLHMIVRRRPDTPLSELIGHFCDMDLILLEGGKHSPYPKIELVRAALSDRPVCDPALLLAVCSDLGRAPEGAAALALDDYDAAAALIARYLAEGGRAGA